MAACCLYGAFILSMFLKKYQLFQTGHPSNPASPHYNFLADPNGDSELHEGFDTFDVVGMTCTNCVESIEASLSRKRGVKRVVVDLLLAQAEIAYDKRVISPYEVAKELEATGFSATHKQSDADSSSTRKDLGAWNWGESVIWGSCILIPLLVLDHLPEEMIRQSNRQLYVLILGAVIQWGFGLPFHRRTVLAFKDLGLFHLPMDVLVSMSTSCAYLASLFFYARGKTENFAATSASLIVAISFSKYIEAGLRSSVTEIARALADTIPASAQLHDSGISVPVKMLRTGDVVAVDAGTRFPCDGKLIARNGQESVTPFEIDESFQTGETRHVLKSHGDFCLAGTVNSGTTAALIEVGQGATSRLVLITQVLTQAQRYKSELQPLVDRFASAIVPAMIFLSFLTFALWVPRGIDQALRFMTATMVVACPCAIALATPTAVMLGSSICHKHGVLLKQGIQAIEVVPKVTTICLDKTGTLTTGRMKVNGYRLSGSWRTESWWRIIQAAEYDLQHWAAVAIRTHISDLYGEGRQDDNLLVARDRTVCPGSGVRCFVNGHSVVVGNYKFVTASGTVDPVMREDLESLRPWQSYLMVSLEGRYAGIVMFSDELAPDICRSIAMLKSLKYEVCMLTGDREPVAAYVAGAVGIDQYWAELTPDQKMERIQQARLSGKTVAMVGDGINDAPALAKADLGIALHTGAPLALASADIVLLNSSIAQLPSTVRASKAIVGAIRLSLIWATVYNSVLIPIAMGCLNPWGITLHPTLAGILMSGSSMGVLLNSLRLKSSLEQIYA